MYISNFFVKNFRSLKEVNLNFYPGKNVIIGKNNSGKSNIITALDILFNEKSPIYKSFDRNDFHTCKLPNEETGEIEEKCCEYFYIEATLEGREFDENKIKEIKKSTAFSRLKSRRYILAPQHGEIHINIKLLTNLDEIEKNSAVEEIESTSKAGKSYPTKTRWMNSSELIEFLKEAVQIRVFFAKSLDEGSGFGLIVQDNKNNYWLSHFFNNKLREALITTAIIPAFRNPKDELRLTHYTWYGKLMKYLWERGKSDIESEIIQKGKDITELGNRIFYQSTIELKNLLKQAISHDNVSFKLVNSNPQELYKEVSIYIDDGIDRPLEQKGSGIQSAIIISLFTTYCSNFHQTSSLLIAEEPELFLHPQARRVISAELARYLVGDEGQKRQIILSTHSTEFIKNVDVTNIIVARKNSYNNQTFISQISYDEALTKEEVNRIIRLIWSKNTEIFFSDKVLLVEGGEEYLIPAIFDKLSGDKQLLDYKNITVARVDGKSNFITYIKILNRFNIPWIILGDLDCYNDVLPILMNECNISLSEYITFKKMLGEVQTDYKNISRLIIRNEASQDGLKLYEIFKSIKEGSASLNDPELIRLINYMEERFGKTDLIKHIESNSDLEELFNKIQTTLKEKKIIILKNGAIEAYYTTLAKAMEGRGKDNKALEIAAIIQEANVDIKDYINNLKEFEELLEITTDWKK